ERRWTRAEVRAEVDGALRDVGELPPDLAIDDEPCVDRENRDDLISDLGFDSKHTLELILAAEDRLALEIPVDHVVDCQLFRVTHIHAYLFRSLRHHGRLDE